jgi:hypothetical protein
MKNFKITYFLIFFYFCYTSFSQTQGWNTYDFDSIVSVDMPFDVYEVDTIQNNQKTYEIYASNDTSSFFVKKTYLGKLYSNQETITLPYDTNSLKEFYSNLTWGLYESSKYKVEATKSIKYHNLKGYKYFLKNKDDILTKEINLIIVNEHLYNFSYTNINGINEIDKNIFFDSIKFTKKIKLQQFTNKSYTFNYTLLTLLILLLLSFFLRGKPKKRNN